MRAGIEQDTDHAVVATNQDHWTARYAAGTKIARVRHLRFVTGVDPALVEDATPLLVETFGIRENSPIYPEKTRRLVVDDERFV
jgi:hypothetical protein